MTTAAATPTTTTRPPNGAPPRTASTPPPKPASRIGAIKRGQLRRPLRCLFYGAEGVGKSSLAADAPDPVFLDIEGGADNIDAARYPFRDEPGGHVPRTYAEVVAAIEDLTANDHGFRTVVLDTVDALESLVHRHVCKEHGQASIESFGYGKGYQVALDVFRQLLVKLDALRDRGVQVVLLGHSTVKTFKNPLGEDFDRYQLRVHEKAAGLIKEWCDVVGFIRFDEGAAKLVGDSGQTKRARGFSTGARLVSLARSAAWDAKSRISLPDEIALGEARPWEPFATAQAGARDTTDADLLADVEAELARLGDEFTASSGKPGTAAKVRAAIAGADRSTLTRILGGLRASTPINQTAADAAQES